MQWTMLGFILTLFVLCAAEAISTKKEREKA